MSNLIIGYGTQGKKRYLNLGKNRKTKSIIFDPKIKNLNKFKNFNEIDLSKITHAYICTPETEKEYLIDLFVEEKINVLVEKPLLLDEKKIKKIDKSLKSTIYTAYNHRFEPHIVNIKKILDQKKIGEIYNVNCHYGNGTAQLWKNSWREKEKFAIVYDLGSHVIDTMLYLFGKLPNSYQIDIAQKNELKCYDYLRFSSNDAFCFSGTLSIVNWRNYFSLDIIGSKGSIHINGLCKWGPSLLTLNKRVFPSGYPKQKTKKLIMADPTWAKEEKFFKKLSSKNLNNLKENLLINKALEKIS